jgi:6-oxo-cyclohex-1-ene-carbonyl-CoA hydrolase
MILRSLLLMLQATQGDGLAFDPFSLQQDCLAASVDLLMLDEKVVALCTKLLYTFLDCTTKTVEELRKPKLDAWNRNKENSRAWLALNMMTEARAGFRAFNEGTKETGREAEFIALRRALAANAPWTDELTESIQPGAGRK